MSNAPTSAQINPSSQINPSDQTSTTRTEMTKAMTNTIDLNTADLDTVIDRSAPDSVVGTGPTGPVVTLELAPFDDELVGRQAVARCADGNGTLTPLFFSDHVLDIARAKAICARCALRSGCLTEALDREEPWGVWGGELLSGGRVVAVKRPGGRPPKRPRPPLLVDESGIVEVPVFPDTA